MKKRDTNQQAVKEVERVTGSKPVKGELLLRSPELKRILREAKKRVKN